MPTQLPPKENTLFKRILKCYEQKQYKNGLKFCKQILSNPKFAEHGETLAMKGLTLNYLGRKEEAYDYVKKGLKNDLRSHVCWHVYGLLQRADHKYDEAIKCYRNALKWDKDNIQILRDLSLLQVQMRDREGFRDTRYQLLKIRPAQRQSWIGYSISYYLLGNCDMAFTVMEEFRKTISQENQGKADIEHSEMLFYQNMILREQEKYKESLDHLEKYEHLMTDKLKVQENKALLHMKLDNHTDAEKIYRELVKRNPENKLYYEGIEKCLAAQSPDGILGETEQLAIYSIYRKRYPYTETPRRLPLTFCKGEVFKGFADEYLRNALKKGIPPLFTNMRSLYSDKTKAGIIEELVLGFRENLKEINKFHPQDDTTQDPTVYLWTNFYLAQHFDYFKKTNEALMYIKEVLDHTPTLIEGYMVQAKIYKHAGSHKEAALCMDEGRSLDTADRYVNSKSAKYLLRTNDNKKAIETCGLFTKEGTSPDEDLDSMQCMWFGIESAAAHQRKGEIGEALAKCHQIERNFSEIVEDQFDFHTYCMRKVTLCAYIKLLKLEDKLRCHLFYFKAAKIAIECYLGLYDKPYSTSDDAAEVTKGNLSAKELKKLKSKQRRAQKKQQVEDEKKATEAKEPKDPDLKKEEGKGKIDPSELINCKSPLEEAIKFLIPLQILAKDRIETHLMAFDIYYRKGKPLLMLQSLLRAFKCDPYDARLHCCIVQFLSKVQADKDGYSEIVTRVIDQEISSLNTNVGVDTYQYNKDYLELNSRSHRARVEVGRGLYAINSSDPEALQLILTLNPEFNDTSLKLCTEIYNQLAKGGYGATPADKERYRKSCSEFYLHADLFKTETDETSTRESEEVKEPSPCSAEMNGFST